MKKYKLIKEYPGSENLETIAWIDGYKTHFNGNEYIDEIIEFDNYPEFWQEVIEKEYEILSFKDKYSNLVVNKTNHQYLYQGKSRGMEVSLDFCLGRAKKYWDIYSIKRLSDGEIFTIDDKTKYGTITEFYLTHDNFIVYKTSTGSSGVNISLWKKTKKPLFTTEDGVDIFEGNEYTFVRSNYSYKTCIAISSHESSKLSNDYLGDFSTKEAAEEYILINKPCLSINDIKTLRYKNLMIYDEDLKQLVKSKTK